MTQIIVPLLRVLVLMHEQHILHRDIKPENIFLTGKHKLKLGDLGLAIRSNEELPFTRSGTLDYMAPEVMSLLLNMRLHGGQHLLDFASLMPCAHQGYIQDQHNVYSALTTDMHICLSFTAAHDQVHIIWQCSLP